MVNFGLSLPHVVDLVIEVATFLTQCKNFCYVATGISIFSLCCKSRLELREEDLVGEDLVHNLPSS